MLPVEIILPISQPFGTVDFDILRLKVLARLSAPIEPIFFMITMIKPFGRTSLAVRSVYVSEGLSTCPRRSTLLNVVVFLCRDVGFW